MSLLDSKELGHHPKTYKITSHLKYTASINSLLRQIKMLCELSSDVAPSQMQSDWERLKDKKKEELELSFLSKGYLHCFVLEVVLRN